MSGNLAGRQDAVNAADQAQLMSAFNEVVVAAFRLNGVLTAAGDSLSAPTGQTSARWRVLAAVEEQSMSVAEIARAWSLTRQSVQRVTDLLERDGLVEFRDNPAHRRAKLVALTSTGRSVLRRIQAAQQPWAERVARCVGVEPLRAAARALELLYQVIRQEEA